jgi:hypothetical protein
MNSTRKIFIDSSQRSYGNAYNFNMLLREPIHGVKGIRLSEAYIPNSFYNVCSSFGNTITLTDGGGSDTLTISDGNYSISSLLTAIQTAANASGTLTETYTLTYSSTTGKTTFSATGNFSITTTTLASKIGFRVTTGSATSHVGGFFTDLRPTKNIFVSILNLPIYSNFNSVVIGCIGSIPIADVFLSTMRCDIDYEMIQLRNINTIDTLNIVLFDDSGRILENNNVEWSMTLEIEIEE